MSYSTTNEAVASISSQIAANIAQLGNDTSLEQIIKEAVRAEVQKGINQVLATELTGFLEYEYYSRQDKSTSNRRNGYTHRTIDSVYGPLEISFPRDRFGEFSTKLFQPYARRTDGLEETIIHLYSRGTTTSEISDLIEKMYGAYYTPATISKITQNIQDNVDAFHHSPLLSRYVAIYADAIYMNLRRDTVAKEPVHILIGVDEEGNKQILDYAVYPSESSENYREMFQRLKERGVEQVLVVVSDGLKGMKEACEESFTGCRHQTCWVHIQRNMCRKVRVTDRKEITEDLKSIYQAETKEDALDAFRTFNEKWKGKYSKAVKQFSENPSLFTFYDFPKAIRKSLYTSNTIESFNKQIRADSKKKQQFPNEESQDRFLFMVVTTYNQNRSRKVFGFSSCQYELSMMFENQANSRI